MGSDKKDRRRSRSKDKSDKKSNKSRDDDNRHSKREKESKQDSRSKEDVNRERSRSIENRRRGDKDTNKNDYDRGYNSRNNKRDYNKTDDRREDNRRDNYKRDKDQQQQQGQNKNRNEIIIEISAEERQGGRKEKDNINDSELITSLKYDVGFLTMEYNRKQKEQKEKEIQEAKDAKEKKTLELFNPTNGRAGGVYVPPYKLRLLQEEMMKNADNQGEEHQRLMWDLLRKSINGIVNKVNISNIQNVIVELLNENLLRGKGLFARAIIKAQLSSPNFTHVYTALIAVINTKMPDIVDLIIRRVILQFQRSYKRNNKLVCEAAIKMIAHLINQRILSDFVGLQLMFLLLEDPNEDKVDLACQFMIEGGQVLSEATPDGTNAIFERLKGILHEGECEKRVQYSIEHLFAVRKTKFKDHPGVIPELDLVEEEDIIEHNYDLLDQIDPEDHINLFKYDPLYEKSEQEWESIKLEILGEENILSLKQIKTAIDEEEGGEENENQMVIKDLTDEDRVNLRRTLYLVIMSSVDFEECAHKILKMSLGVGHEDEICLMIQECCQNERTYLKFYGLLAQRFCEMTELYKDNFMKCFVELYSTIHRFETAKIRNSAKFYAHLFYTDSIDWRIFACITLTQDTTTASSRIFIKNLILEICENTGLENLQERFNKEEHQEFFGGLFPKDHPRNTRFAINFFISIGLGALTEKLSEHLKKQTEEMQKLQFQQQVEEITKTMEQEEESSSSSSSDSSSDSSESDSESSGSESSSSSEEESENDKKKRNKDKKKSEQKKSDQKSKQKKK